MARHRRFNNFYVSMIGSIIYLIGGSIINIYTWLASSLVLIMPDQFQTALSYFFGTVNVISPIFPVATLMSCLLVILSAWLVKIGLKIVLWFLSWIPGIGHHDLPKILDSDPNTLNLRERGSNTIDLRHRLFKGRKSKNTRDIR